MKISPFARNPRVISGRIDLHVHSNRSDGRLPPNEILRLCHQQGINVLSLADHDRLSPDLRNEAGALGIRVIPNIELGSYRGDPTDMMQALHILGFGISSSSGMVTNKLAQMEAVRQTDCAKFRQALESEGLEVLENDVLRHAKGQVPRKFHYSGATAQNPNNRGRLAELSPDPKNTWLTLRQIMAGCASRESVLSPLEAVILIRTAGGWPVLAHPCHKMDGWPTPEDPGLIAFVEEAAPLGLAGIECISSHHVKVQNPLHSGHPFQLIPATHSAAFRPPVPF